MFMLVGRLYVQVSEEADEATHRSSRSTASFMLARSARIMRRTPLCWTLMATPSGPWGPCSTPACTCLWARMGHGAVRARALALTHTCMSRFAGLAARLEITTLHACM